MPYDPDEIEDKPSKPTHYANSEESWTETWYALFKAGGSGKAREIDEDDSTIIENAIKREFGSSLKGWEIAKAVRTCARNKPSYPPNTQELINAIRDNRISYKLKQTANPDNTFHVVLRMTHLPGPDGHPIKREAHRVVEPPDMWKRRLEMATPKDRWEIICEPLIDAQCAQREVYAINLRGGYEKPTQEENAEMKAEILACIVRIEQHMKNNKLLTRTR